MQLLHCDKPYNLDEAAARRGTPRRKRKDSRTTAYELTIRIPEEHRRHFGGKKKLTRVVFALLGMLGHARFEIVADQAHGDPSEELVGPDMAEQPCVLPHVQGCLDVCILRVRENRDEQAHLLLALPQNQPNAPLYPAGGAPGSRPGALPHFGRPRYLGPPPRARSTAG